jgi:hypothetical protein
VDRSVSALGAQQVAVARQRIDIDRHKLRAAIRKLRREDVFFMLYDAIELLPSAKLWKVVGKYLDPRSLRSDGDKATTANLLAEVRAFARASLAGEYYDCFDVNSRNSMEKSTGTTAWIADCHRLLKLCVDQARKPEPTDVLQAFDIIFGLLDRIDDGREIMFFADEAGAWQVGVHSWFSILSATARPDEYGQRIVSLLKHHYDYGSTRTLALARKAATPAQREALSKSATAAIRPTAFYE